MTGVIYKALSGFYYVEAGGETVECKARGRFRMEGLTPLVGDRVEFTPGGSGKGVLDKILPRKNAFQRPAIANLEQIVIFAAAVNPVTDPFLLDTMIAIAVQGGCKPIVCINKCDADGGDKLFSIYKEAGYTTLRTSAVSGEGLTALQAQIAGKISAFAGNSGVGKSSILNALAPQLALKVGDVSQKLGRGRHTTRHVEMFRIGDAFVADTPGVSAFDMEGVSYALKDSLTDAFLEFQPYLGKCRYRDCAHIKEPGCAVLEALAAAKIAPSRHESYVRLHDQAAKLQDWQMK